MILLYIPTTHTRSRALTANNIQVTIRAHAFIRSANSITELPVESIATAVSVTKELVLNSNIPMSLSTFLGVIPCRKQANLLIVLQPSLLHDDNSSLAGQKPRVLVTQAITKWIISCVCGAVTELCEVSKHFLYRTTPCLTFQYRGLRPIGYSFYCLTNAVKDSTTVPGASCFIEVL